MVVGNVMEKHRNGKNIGNSMEIIMMEVGNTLNFFWKS